MTDEEFERLKEAEKEHLREKKKLRSTLKALKRRNRVQSVVETMRQGAERLLDETGALVDTLRGQFAKEEARLEMSLDDEEIDEAEQELREERADELIRQYKSSQSPSAKSGSTNAESEDDASQSGPEKTIGRMKPRDSSEGST